MFIGWIDLPISQNQKYAWSYIILLKIREEAGCVHRHGEAKISHHGTSITLRLLAWILRRDDITWVKIYSEAMLYLIISTKNNHEDVREQTVCALLVHVQYPRVVSSWQSGKKKKKKFNWQITPALQTRKKHKRNSLQCDSCERLYMLISIERQNVDTDRSANPQVMLHDDVFHVQCQELKMFFLCRTKCRFVTGN